MDGMSLFNENCHVAYFKSSDLFNRIMIEIKFEKKLSDFQKTLLQSKEYLGEDIRYLPIEAKKIDELRKYIYKCNGKEVERGTFCRKGIDGFWLKARFRSQSSIKDFMELIETLELN